MQYQFRLHLACRILPIMMRQLNFTLDCPTIMYSYLQSKVSEPFGRAPKMALEDECLANFMFTTWFVEARFGRQISVSPSTMSRMFVKWIGVMNQEF